jgi:hypothetical protein
MTSEAEEQDGIAHFKYLTEVALPQRAQEERWPLRLDHCFKRVCLDYAFGGEWYRHIAKPAERNLHGAALLRAVSCAEEILREGRSLLEVRNRESLLYRGKLRR